MIKIESSKRYNSSIGRLLLDYNMVLVLAVIFAFFVITTGDTFLKTKNLLNVLRQVSINGLVATGMTLVILTGGIDLSVGSVIAFSSVVAATIANEAHSYWWLAIPAAIGLAVIVGVVSGFFVSYLKIAPFIMTLAMMTIARGSAFIFSNGKPVSGVIKSFLVIGKGSFLGLPLPTWILIVAIIFTFIILTYTSFGRYIYAIGGNENAAKISGINVRLVKLGVYTLAGFFTGLASVVLTSRVSAGLPQVAQGYEMEAIAAVVLGGTSLAGGKGSIWGTVIGVLIIGLISNGMDLMNIQSYTQQIVQGCVIVFAVLIDSVRNERDLFKHISNTFKDLFGREGCEE